MKIKQRRKYDDVLPGQWWEVDQNKVSYLQEKKQNKASKKSKREQKILHKLAFLSCIGSFCTREWSFILQISLNQKNQTGLALFVSYSYSKESSEASFSLKNKANKGQINANKIVKHAFKEWVGLDICWRRQNSYY